MIFNRYDHLPISREGSLFWIKTFQEHINVAWYDKLNKKFYNCGNYFVDKHGECDVEYWCEATSSVPKGFYDFYDEENICE